MPKVSANKASFIAFMTKSEEHERYGFELLSAEDDSVELFDALKDAGLFAPEKNPGPMPVDDRSVRIPYWSALDYLAKCARVAAKAAEGFELARKVLGVVTTITRARGSPEGHPDNFHTNWKFAEIVGLVPLSSIDSSVIELIPWWLESKYDRGLVVSELDKGLLRKLLESSGQEHAAFACSVTWHCTDFRRGIPSNRSPDGSDLSFVADEFWLNELIDHHATRLGAKAQNSGVLVFFDRLSKLYAEPERSADSWVFRPAIEEHEQNFSWKSLDNVLVKGLRDALTGWVNVDPSGAEPVVSAFLVDEHEIVRRIAIHVLCEQWAQLGHVYPKVLSPALFEEGNLHEMYRLLSLRFEQFTQIEQEATVAAIKAIPIDENWREPETTHKSIQLRWFSAIAHRGCASADALYEELKAEPLGDVPEHADFHVFMESSFGPGPSPYTPEQLVELAMNGAIVERLNSFRTEAASWRGPNRRALSEALEQAVKAKPQAFIPIIASFLGADHPYQYALISGLKDVWEAKQPENMAKLNWPKTWGTLLDFFKSLLDSDGLWLEAPQKDSDLTPTRHWIAPAIAGFLRSGTREDDHAYPVEFSDSALAIIQKLLAHLPRKDVPGEDPMLHAINSARGKTIEALFSHALRICRLADRERPGDHAEAWAKIQPIMDRELAACQNANFDFSTMAGAYLGGLDYMSSGWLSSRLKDIFAESFEQNFVCAASGLIHAPTTRRIYQALSGAAVIRRIVFEWKGPVEPRERVVQRAAIAMLWGDEALDGAIFAPLFLNGDVGSLCVVADLLRSVYGEKLSPSSLQRARDFIDKSINWASAQHPVPSRFVAKLARLAVYIEDLDERERVWLNVMAKHVHADHQAAQFIEQLSRLVTKSPKAVGSATLELARHLERGFYDYKNGLSNLTAALIQSGLRLEGLEIAKSLHYLPEFRRIFERLTTS